jgi:hypothetical protein
MSDKLQFVDWFGSDKLKLTGQLFPTFDATVALTSSKCPTCSERALVGKANDGE